MNRLYPRLLATTTFCLSTPVTAAESAQVQNVALMANRL